MDILCTQDYNCILLKYRSKPLFHLANNEKQNQVGLKLRQAAGSTIYFCETKYRISC